MDSMDRKLHAEALERLASSRQRATERVDALESQVAELRLCLLAEAGDPRGVVGLRTGWEPRAGNWWRFRGYGRGDALLFRQWGGGLRARFARGMEDVPAGMSIRDAMRWVEEREMSP